MASYCGEIVTIPPSSYYSPEKLMHIGKIDDFRPQISFAYNIGQNDTVSLIDFDTFSVSTGSVTEVEEKPGFWSRVRYAISSKIASIGRYLRCCCVWNSSATSA
ncbi:hypothetical protein NLJ89_g696 [Agrocybe chaxingu]|uniref:Uncharacterized protein n=1 Tax=Agrocybe chaxingu TaxID=84603 RepID=A0A9W8N1I4_9AGAR|nr:hypothetical protein NLJ89_g696 [Agrocybe chaxingu]